MTDLLTTLWWEIALRFRQLRQTWRWHTARYRSGPTISHGWVPPDTP